MKKCEKCKKELPPSILHFIVTHLTCQECIDDERLKRKNIVSEQIEEDKKIAREEREREQHKERVDKYLKEETERKKGSQWLLYLKKAVALGELGKNQEAIEIYDKAIEIRPGFYQPHLLKADNLIKLGKFQEAMSVVEKVLEKEHGNADAIITKEHIEILMVEAQIGGKVIGTLSADEYLKAIKNDSLSDI